jgi:hypothetical protein
VNSRAGAVAGYTVTAGSVRRSASSQSYRQLRHPKRLIAPDAGATAITTNKALAWAVSAQPEIKDLRW